MTARGCGFPASPDGRQLCDRPARLFPCGWRCKDHEPAVLLSGAKS